MPGPDLREQMEQLMIAVAGTWLGQAWPQQPDALAVHMFNPLWARLKPELDRRDVQIGELQATLARVKELALMGGQDPISIRQWIIAEVVEPREPK
jgi:hypothetical protein